MIRTDLGKIGAAIEAGRTASSNINYGPIPTLDIVNNQNNKPVSDWHNEPPNPDNFLAGVNKWGDLNKIVAS
jgi:hypothetical protein